MTNLAAMIRPSICLVTALWIVVGCRSTNILEEPPICEAPITRKIETANICAPLDQMADDLSAPMTVNTDQPPEDWYLTLEEAVRITLANSDVIRDLGGRVLSGAAPSIYDVAQQELGEELALSAFDATVNSNIFFNRDERAFNNPFFGGGATSVSSNTATHRLEVAKTGVTGTQYLVRTLNDYNRNSVPSNLFNSVYDTAIEAEFRHPLLRGAGLAVNRIAGPNGGPGVYNGVILQRIRTDISLIDFEVNVRDLVRSVEQEYWRLYFTYRQLDARKAAYESTLASWRTAKKQLDAGNVDGEAEANARARYYEAKVNMENALAGNNDGQVGVQSTERNLRRLMGIPATDGRIIRPADEPSEAKRIFDWQDSLEMAIHRRPELRRQRWVVKQRQNELLASKNYLLSQLDFIGLYRWRGFGDDLFGNGDTPNGSSWGDILTGDLQGWQLGLQYSTTLGKRQEHVAVRRAELLLARDRAVLRSQEQIIGNSLSAAYAEIERLYVVARDNFNRAVAERQRLEFANAKYEVGQELLEFVLQAQQRTADADSQYYLALVDYNTAISNVHLQRGTYLDYMGVRLSEGAWSPESYASYRKEFRRFKPRMSYCKMDPCPVSSGTYSQFAPLTSNRIPQNLQRLPQEVSYESEVTPVPIPIGAGDVPFGQPSYTPAPAAPAPVTEEGYAQPGFTQAVGIDSSGTR